MIRVLVVDDSAFMRKLISDYINEDPDMTAADTARNGKDALEKARNGRFDVITLDVEMPEMDGMEALCSIMETCPHPVIMVSSLTRKGAQQTITALESGAVDFVAKPSGSISLDLHHVKEEIIEKIRTAAQVEVKQKNEPPASTVMHKAQDEPDGIFLEGKKTVAIATSTGGPKALQVLLSDLPKDLPAPVFVIQHMPPAFTRSLAERLNQRSSLFVKEAEDGEIAKTGTVYIAPGGRHLAVRRMGRSLVTEVLDTSPVNGHRPSADVLFSSLAAVDGFSHVGIVLTGMGSDGSAGLVEMKNAQKCLLITESQRTSIVYGMPKAARQRAAAEYSLDLGDIAGFLSASLLPGSKNRSDFS
ncbi:protein-glutamate methylesterase/protein-glutamine glutaminase [Salibacterium halotolerans]|uniref:Protein-glutamate methylesterase/protein-glutamine glutaminase n=1 Tax=Salibacterium halotolerans TaxID=1884432 RepID=A0A1I5MGT2_9BACI|nr:chemotaxis response regulator protein-glutamate methylesterase [Salibacterium halotolerans]SFP08146.1 two-component system, chemotaxis family, response regulator CheB [Salibacterium halotolerans]